MKISNFQPVTTIKGIKHATIDITYSFFWKTWTKTVPVYKSPNLFWRFLDTGEYTPSYTVETLEELYYIKQDFL